MKQPSFKEQEHGLVDGLQLWHLGVRSLTSTSTSRAACFLLHALLAMELVLWHDVSDSVGGLVTGADINGPAILSDTALSLMLHLLHLRNSEVPGASADSTHQVLRWLFRKLEPSRYF
jgi:ataxia telangiectasia mutated family protein